MDESRSQQISSVANESLITPVRILFPNQIYCKIEEKLVVMSNRSPAFNLQEAMLDLDSRSNLEWSFLLIFSPCVSALGWFIVLRPPNYVYVLTLASCWKIEFKCANLCSWFCPLFLGHRGRSYRHFVRHTYFSVLKFIITRVSSCVNARGIPPAA